MAEVLRECLAEGWLGGERDALQPHACLLPAAAFATSGLRPGDCVLLQRLVDAVPPAGSGAPGTGLDTVSASLALAAPGCELLAAPAWPCAELAAGRLGCGQSLAASLGSGAPRLRVLRLSLGGDALLIATSATLQLLPPEADAAQEEKVAPPTAATPPRTPPAGRPPAGGSPGAGRGARGATPVPSPPPPPPALDSGWLAAALCGAPPESTTHPLLLALAASSLAGSCALAGGRVAPLRLLGGRAAAVLSAAQPAAAGGGSAPGACVYAFTRATVLTLLPPPPAGTEPPGFAAVPCAPDPSAGAFAARSLAAGAAAPPAGLDRLAWAPAGARPALRRSLVAALAAGRWLDAAAVPPPRCALLHGPPGCGKAALALAAARTAGAAVVDARCDALMLPEDGEGGATDGPAACLRALFAAAATAAPCLLLLRRAGGLWAAPGGLGSLLAALIDGLPLGAAVAVAATCTTGDLDALPQRLARPGRLGDACVRVGPPARGARRCAALRSALAAAAVPTPPDFCDDGDAFASPPGCGLRRLAERCGGLGLAQLGGMARTAARLALADHAAACARAAARGEPDPPPPGCVSEAHLEDARAEAVTAAAASAASAAAASGAAAARWAAPQPPPGGIAGLDGPKRALAELVGGAGGGVGWAGGAAGGAVGTAPAAPWSAPQLRRLLGARGRPPRGALLFGPPGCAKTSLVAAAAAAAGRPLLIASAADLLSAYVGASEKAVRALFRAARDAAPAVLFLDEVDALAPPRGGAHGGAHDRVVAQLLVEMDGGGADSGGEDDDEEEEVEADGDGGSGVAAAPWAQGPPLVLLAATNRPDRVDAALLRPGRLDRLVYVGPPHGAAELAAVLASHTASLPLAPCVCLTDLARSLPAGATGADVAALVRGAQVAALAGEEAPQALRRAHFDASLLRLAPSSQPDAGLQAVYDRMQRGA